jgi:DNA adenine methylase
LGGKAKISKKLVDFLESKRKPNQLYVEPFLGGCNVLPHLSGERWGNEIIPDLILLYCAIRDGWVPPSEIQESLYNKLKTEKPSPLRGMAAIGCSFSGKWFGGYARSKDRNYALNAKNGLMKIAPKIKSVKFTNMSYDEMKIPEGSLVYCDPPYEKTTKYKNQFSHKQFWCWARCLSKTCDVYVSEYSAPEDFVEVWKVERNLEMRTNKHKTEKRTERLFKYAL